MKSATPWVCASCQTANNGNLEWCLRCGGHVSRTNPKRRGKIKLRHVPQWVRRHGRERRTEIQEFLHLSMIGVYTLDRHKFIVRFGDDRVWLCNRSNPILEVTMYDSVVDFHGDNDCYWPFYVQNLGIEQLDCSAVEDPLPIQFCRLSVVELVDSEVVVTGVTCDGDVKGVEVAS